MNTVNIASITATIVLQMLNPGQRHACFQFSTVRIAILEWSCQRDAGTGSLRAILRCGNGPARAEIVTQR